MSADLALFDFDGTITKSYTWAPFLRRTVPPVRFALGRVLLLPVGIAYRLRWLSGARGRQIATWVALRGLNATTVREHGVEYAREALPREIRPEALERIAWHRARGDRIVVVSAALDAYLLPWCQAQGFDVICTVLEEHEGRLTGRLLNGDCSGPEKARRIREKFDLAQHPTIYAYGDSLDDREMLECATEKYYQSWPPPESTLRKEW